MVTALGTRADRGTRFAALRALLRFVRRKPFGAFGAAILLILVVVAALAR